MPSTPISILGNLVADPVYREQIGAATLRIAAQHSHFDRSTGSYVDDGASFYNVTAWGQLGINAANSLRRGERAIVAGTLRIREYTTDSGENRISADISASGVGPDLTWGRSTFMRVDHGARSQDTVAQTNGSATDESPADDTAADEDSNHAQPLLGAATR